MSMLQGLALQIYATSRTVTLDGRAQHRRIMAQRALPTGSSR